MARSFYQTAIVIIAFVQEGCLVPLLTILLFTAVSNLVSIYSYRTYNAKVAELYLGPMSKITDKTRFCTKNLCVKTEIKSGFI
jgi:hypothetical protein